MTISEFVNILLSCCKATYHIEADKEPNEFIVWSEIGERGLNSDNIRSEETTLVAVDFLTKEEFSRVPEKLKRAFRENEISYKGPEIIYNKDTKRTQYAYTCEVV